VISGSAKKPTVVGRGISDRKTHDDKTTSVADKSDDTPVSAVVEEKTPEPVKPVEPIKPEPVVEEKKKPIDLGTHVEIIIPRK
jgi:hypothetical protein